MDRSRNVSVLRGVKVTAMFHLVLKLKLRGDLLSWGGMSLSPFCTSATDWPILPAPGDR
jgi:hypothetical protein